MDKEMVTSVVRQLHADGEKATARAVLERTGGSMRDVCKLLREAREFLDDEEVAALATELPAPAPPALGDIRKTFQSAQEAVRDMGRISAMLNAARERLKDLFDHRPLRPVDPDDVEDWIIAKRGYLEEVAILQETISYFQNLYLERQSEEIAFRHQANILQRHATELQNFVLPKYRREVAEAEEGLRKLLLDQAHAQRLAEGQVANLRAARRACEAELQGLTGEQVR